MKSSLQICFVLGLSPNYFVIVLIIIVPSMTNIAFNLFRILKQRWRKSHRKAAVRTQVQPWQAVTPWLRIPRRQSGLRIHSNRCSRSWTRSRRLATITHSIRHQQELIHVAVLFCSHLKTPKWIWIRRVALANPIDLVGSNSTRYVTSARSWRTSSSRRHPPVSPQPWCWAAPSPKWTGSNVTASSESNASLSFNRSPL